MISYSQNKRTGIREFYRCYLHIKYDQQQRGRTFEERIVVFQKISIPPTEGNENCNGRGVVQKEAISEEVAVSYRELFPGVPSKILVS